MIANRFVIYGDGKVKHLAAPVVKGKRSGTACGMFWDTGMLHDADESSMPLPVCGACRRSTRGKLLSNIMEL